MENKTKNIIKFLIRIVVTTSLMALVITRIDTKQDFVETIKNARWEFLILCWAISIAIYWLDSVKMRFILKKQDCDVAVPTIFLASFITAFYSMILPGILSTGAKWYILKKNTNKGTNVFSCMVYNQLSSMLVLTVFGLIGLIISNPTTLILKNQQTQWMLPTACSILLIATIAFSLLLLNHKAGIKIIKIINVILKPFPQKLQQKANEIFDQITIFQKQSWKFHLKAAALTTIASFAGLVALYILAAKGANINAPVTLFMWLPSLIFLLGRIPISIANLGVREVTLTGILAIYGVPASSALLLSMIIFSGLVMLALIGGICQIYLALKPKTN